MGCRPSHKQHPQAARHLTNRHSAILNFWVCRPTVCAPSITAANFLQSADIEGIMVRELCALLFAMACVCFAVHRCSPTAKRGTHDTMRAVLPFCDTCGKGVVLLFGFVLSRTSVDVFLWDQKGPQ